MTDNTERERFESWACQEFDLDTEVVLNSRCVDEEGVEGYGDPDMDNDDEATLTGMWFAWQARGRVNSLALNSLIGAAENLGNAKAQNPEAIGYWEEQIEKVKGWFQ